MGEYYKFTNKTRMEESQVSLSFNFGLPWAKNMHRKDDREVEAIFRFVVKHNEGWQLDDELEAVGDYGHVIKFNEVHVEEKGFGWESYEPERVPPKKLEEPPELVESHA